MTRQEVLKALSQAEAALERAEEALGDTSTAARAYIENAIEAVQIASGKVATRRGAMMEFVKKWMPVHDEILEDVPSWDDSRVTAWLAAYFDEPTTAELEEMDPSLMISPF